MREFGVVQTEFFLKNKNFKSELDNDAYIFNLLNQSFLVVD